MAWIPAIAAASAASACHTGQGKKLPKWAVLFIILTMAIGIIIPLSFVLMRSQTSSSLIIMPLVFFCFILLGVVSMVVLISSEDEKKERDTKTRPTTQRRRSRPRKSDYWEEERSESVSWAPPTQVRREQYCTNCGTTIDNEDNFCDQCGWEVRTRSYDRR
jgi:choline-glycine betaine transporter